MAKKDGQSAVNFQSETSGVEFRPDQSLGTESGGSRLAEAAQNVNWNKVGIGVGAAAVAAGAALAAKKLIGGRESGGESSGGGSQDG